MVTPNPTDNRTGTTPSYDERTTDGARTTTDTVSDRPLEHDRHTTAETRTAHRKDHVAARDTTTTTGARRTHHRTEHDHSSKSSSQKGLWVGVLTFLALALIDWLAGPSLSSLEALTFGDVVVYAIIGVVVGWIVKVIDERRHHGHSHHAA